MNRTKKTVVNKIDKFISKLNNSQINPDLLKKEIIDFLQDNLKHPDNFIRKIDTIQFEPPGVAPTEEAINDKFNQGCKKTIEVLNDLLVKIKRNEIELKSLTSKNILCPLTNLQLFYLAVTITPILFYSGYYYRELKFDKEKYELQDKIIKFEKGNNILSNKIDSLLLIIKSHNAQLPTKNIVHLADSANNEDDNNK